MHLFLSKNSINKFSFYCKAPYEADIGYHHKKKKKRLSVYDWIKNLMTSLCQLGIYFSTSIESVLHFPHQVKSVQWFLWVNSHSTKDKDFLSCADHKKCRGLFHQFVATCGQFSDWYKIDLTSLKPTCVVFSLVFNLEK